LDIGELEIPILLADETDVYIESEKLYSNKPEKFINKLFPELPRHDETGEREIIQITMNTDLNKNTCQWKHLAKNICDYIRNEKNTWVV